MRNVCVALALEEGAGRGRAEQEEKLGRLGRVIGRGGGRREPCSVVDAKQDEGSRVNLE